MSFEMLMFKMFKVVYKYELIPEDQKIVKFEYLF